MLAPFGSRAVLLLELAQPLPRLAGGLALLGRAASRVPTALAQAANDAAHLVLSIADRALKLLSPLLLQLGALELLLLPART